MFDIMKRFTVVGFTMAVMAVAPGVRAEEDFGGMVRKFSAVRREQENVLARDLNLTIPPSVSNFFDAADAGDWVAVSNRCETFFSPDTHGPIPELSNELRAPIGETLGICEVWETWKHDSSLLKMMYGPILEVMPKGSVYFGGTDPGRFVITTVNAVTAPSNLYCITQNALADWTYTSYVRAIYGKDLWLPAQDQVAGAFQRYVEEVRSGKRSQNAEIKIENGRVQVSGALGVMEINGILCEMIFEHNRDSHEFFVEESYVIPWMYPYLEPCGLIMKLNKKQLDKLDEGVVRRDKEFWRDTVGRLLKHPGFTTNEAAMKTFSKLRCGIAGLYAYRKMFAEAESAFREALRLHPASPEANYRLARMYEDQGKIGEARALIEKYAETLDTSDTKTQVANYLKALENKRELTAEERKRLEALVGQLGADDTRTRGAARSELEKFGTRALPLLKEHLQVDDPEVRGVIRDLIRELENEPASKP